jgi:hypothetical protein
LSGKLIPIVSVLPAALDDEPLHAAARIATAARALRPFLLKTFMRSSYLLFPTVPAGLASVSDYVITPHPRKRV